MSMLRVLAISLVLALAGLTFDHNAAQAEAICGGVGKDGKLTAPCAWTAATKVGTPKSACPANSFADIGAATYGCWQCPSGFARGTAAVNTDEACFKFAGDKPMFSDYTSARKLASSTACPAGSFFDPRNKGECWKCPAGFGRNLNAVTESNSCSRANIDISKAQIVEYRAASFVSAACGEKGGFWDPISGGTCWQCPTGYERTVLPAVTTNKACGRRLIDLKPATKVSGFGCKVHGMDAFWDPIGGGSCWVCPKGAQRTTAAVNSPQACQPEAFKWKAADFFNPGLFGFDGGAEVALTLIQKRHAIEQAAVSQGTKIGLSAADAKHQAWEDIKTDPTQNLPLVTAVLDHILNLAIDGRVPTGSPEARLIAAFEKYIQNRRIFAAREALNAYDNWAKAQEMILADRRRNAGTFGGAPEMLGLFSDQTPMPPDFTQRVAGAILTGAATSASVLAGFAANVVSTGSNGDTPAMRLAGKIFVNRTKINTVELELVDDVADDIAKAVKTLAKTGKAGLKFSLSNLKLGSALIASVGPQLVIQVATMVLQAELEKNLAKADARPKLERLLIQAKSESTDLKRLSQNKDKAGEIHTFWAMAVSGEIAPNTKALADIRAAADKALNPHAFDPSLARWYGLPGTAAAIGAGANGEVWHVGGGGSLYHIVAEKDAKWQKVADGGVAQVAPMDQTGVAFVLMDDGSMREVAGGRMTRIDGKATAIAFGGGVKWHIGGNNSLYRCTGKGWQQVSGTGKRIAVDPGGNAWVIGTDDNIYRFANGSWSNVPGTATDIAVGPNGVVWHVGGNNTLYRLIDGGKWKKMNAGNIANIAGGPGGSLWARRSNGQIVAYTPFRPPLAEPGMVKDTTTTKDIGDGITVTTIIVGDPTTTTVVDQNAINHAASNKPKSWVNVSGRASDISVSPAGDVWHVGGGGSLYVMTDGIGSWKQVEKSGVARVAAAAVSGQAFVLMTDGKMREVVDGKWRNVPGWASDIAVSPDGRKWHVGGNGSVYHDTPKGWQRVDGTIARIAGAKGGLAWAVGTNKRIYRFQNGKWTGVPGQAKDVAVGGDGSVWHIGGSDTLYRLAKGDKWEGIDAQGKVAALSVDADGAVWVVRPDGSMAAYR